MYSILYSFFKSCMGSMLNESASCILMEYVNVCRKMIRMSVKLS